MTEDDIRALLWHKQLAFVDFGSVTLVKPTGRYIDTSHTKDEYYLPNRRWRIEVLTGIFLTPNWVCSSQLKPIQMVVTA
jgi:hypothetical protein